MALLEPPAQIYDLLRASVLSFDNKDDSITMDLMSKGQHNEDTKVDDNDNLFNETEIVSSYISFLASGLVNEDNFDKNLWIEILEPYLINHYEQKQLKYSAVPNSSTNGNSVNNNINTKDMIRKFCTEVEISLNKQDDDNESYGDGDEDIDPSQIVCDVRFNLAYGGKILLHQTRLHLLRGRIYALVGQNGVGKTTLMNAINNGKIDGWPTNLRTEYVDSGSNVDPVYLQQNVLQFILNDTNASKDDVVLKLKNELDFTDQMLDGTIGELSGGWQMKLKLARVTMMYPPADCWLLDEPTNHLSSKFDLMSTAN